MREPQSAAAPAPEQESEITTDKSTTAPSAAEAELAEAQAQLAERTADLQRLQAEYVNYKRRVDRDRDLIRKAAVENVLKDLLTCSTTSVRHASTAR